ncbi:MAG: hypothetical protein A2W25_17440 [candidate division Zixibacteria bacterium RBG_16_53_22]|nr:MAG: hypothetical protein A2W25_17440 [candidate division Zixibacteria bacterium RBG_16_53_22]
MKTFGKLVVVLTGMILYAPCAWTQIISTSLPTEIPEGKKLPITAHIMLSPLGSWDYKEVWIGPTESVESGNYVQNFGTLGQSPNSQILVAGELAILLGSKGFAATVGGWFNKVSDEEYDLDGVSLVYSPELDLIGYASYSASVPISITILEGHLGLYYRSFGIQFGMVRSSANSNGDFLRTTIEGISYGDFLNQYPFDVAMTDFTIYGVFKKSIKRWGLSAGLGAYMKQAGPDDAWLRFTEKKTVPSGFLTANFEAIKRMSLDASFWYIGDTEDVKIFEGIASSPSDAQSRLTVGIGYSF